MSRSITPEPTPPQTLTVSTAVGFNAGDLVYFNGSTGDYGTPPASAAGSSVTVPATTSVPLLGGIIGANSSDVGIYGASSSKNFAAVLTDGNIVQVYCKADTNYPSFRVVDTAGAVVVAETVISSVLTQSGAPNIGVAALTGGGFAVAWINGAGGTVDRPCYAVYSNAGVVVSAAQQDLGGVGAGSAAQTLNIKPTPSGGFIYSYYTTGTAISARGYAANGVAAFGWVSLSAVGVNQTHGLAVRSNGDFVLVGVVDNNNIAYAIWSSIGASIVGATSFTLINGTSFQSQTDALCLSDGTTFVLVYKVVITNDTVGFRFLPTGNVLGTEFYIPPNNFYKSGGSYSYPLTATALSGNRFIAITAASIPNTYPISYAVFDSTGACLSGTSGTTSTAALPIPIPQAYFGLTGLQITALESPSGFISLYYTNRNSAKNYSLQVATVNATTYAPVNVTPTTQLAGSVTGTPVTYAPSGSSPLAASFSIAPGTYNAVGTFGEIIKSPELVYSEDVGSIATATLPDGRVLVAYSGTAAGSLVYVAVYSITGVLTQTLSIAAMGSLTLQTFSKISISALSSGKFVIAYCTSATTYDVRLYSSTFTQIGVTVTVTCPGGVTSGYIASVSGLTGDRYAILYSGTTNYLTYRVYDNTNTILVSDVVINGGVDMKQAVICGYSGGGFLVSAKITSGVQQTAQYANTSGNTFTLIVNFAAVTGVTTALQNARAVANTNGNVFMNYAGSASVVVYYGSTLGTNTGSVNLSMSALSNIDGSAVGVAGNGYPALTGQVSGVMRLANAADNTVDLNSVLVKPYVASSFSQNSMTPSYGANIGIAYIDTSSKARYMIVCANTFPVKATLVSTSPSTAIPIYPGTASGTAIQNTVFTGVALQTVPAGGAGAVQILGPAQLNSNYPSTTTYRAFDHQGQGVPGVKGNITGRAITLQGT